MLNHGKQPDAGRGRSQVYDGASRLAVPAACSSADDLMTRRIKVSIQPQVLDTLYDVYT